EPRDRLRDVRQAMIRIGRQPSVEGNEPGALVLTGGAEELRRDFLLHVAVLRVLHEADYFHRELLRGPAVADVLADDGVAAQVELLRERLVDDGDLRRAHRIGRGE